MYLPYPPAFYQPYPNAWGVPGLSDWGVTGVGPMYSVWTGIRYQDYPGIATEAMLMGWCPDCARRHRMPRRRFEQLARDYYGQFPGPGFGPGPSLPPGQPGLSPGPSLPPQMAMPSGGGGTAAPRRNPGSVAQQQRVRFPRRAFSY